MPASPSNPEMSCCESGPVVVKYKCTVSERCSARHPDGLSPVWDFGDSQAKLVLLENVGEMVKTTILTWRVRS